MRIFIVACIAILSLLLIPRSHVNGQDVQGDVYVEASVNNPNPYVGQQVIYSFKLYDAAGLTNPLYQPSSFEGFWRIDIGVISQSIEQVNGRQYNVTTISTALFPSHTGFIEAQPSSVVLPETVFRSKQVLTANPVSLDVKPLPTTTSSNFSGAVGQFSMSATLDRQTAPVGEPLVMTLILSGTGNVEQLPLPLVPDGWRSTTNAGNHKNEIQGGVVIGTREYKIVFIPSAFGTQELPPITFDYFDPVGENYKSISTTPIQIEVTGGDSSAPISSKFVSEPSLQLKSVEKLSTSDSGLLPIVISALLPICFVGGILLWKTIKRRQIKLQRQLKRQQALQLATANLGAVPLTDVRMSYQQIKNIFEEYIAHKLGIDDEQVKHSDVFQLLVESHAHLETLQKVQSFNSSIDEGLFSPATDAMTAHKRDILIELLRKIDVDWGTGLK